MRLLALGLTVGLGLSLLSPTLPAAGSTQPSSSTVTPAESARKAVPRLRVRRLVTGLDHPWDVRPIGRGRLIFTQRDRATVSIWTGSRVRRVDFPSGRVWVSGETGLMGLETDPGFAENRRFFTCQGGRTARGHDVRVMAWRLNPRLTRVVAGKRLLGGLPATSGRHGGCRLLALPDGSLLVGTGDAAVGSNPRDLRSLGGKTLRLHARTGKPWRSNPFVKAANRSKRYVFTYGHRNVQGLDVQPGTGRIWSIEQGTSRDDEANRLVPGGDYGYHPVPGYNESVPMTDHRLPGRQYGATWRSGARTLAASGGGFISGKRWGVYDGTLAVATLKAERVLFLTVQGKQLVRVRVPAALRRHGRIRTVVDGPGPVFYVTTDNGGGRDAILAVRPRA